MYKASELRNKSREELLKLISELKGKLLALRFENATGQLKESHLPKQTKKDIALIFTVLKEQEQGIVIVEKENKVVKTPKTTKIEEPAKVEETVAEAAPVVEEVIVEETPVAIETPVVEETVVVEETKVEESTEETK